MTSDCRQYLETLLWCTTCTEDGCSWQDEGYTPSDFDKASLEMAERDLDSFRDLIAEEDIDLSGSPWDDETQLAHDFALSRNGHGAGFFDRGHKHGAKLQKLAMSYGETNIELGEEDSICFV